LVAAAALAAAGCSMFDRRPPPPCPPVNVVREASAVTDYRNGPGRDVTDVVYSTRIADFRGSCDWNKDRTEVDLELRVLFETERGPANPGRKVNFDYFVAIPAFYPAPQGKRILPVEVLFPENVTRVRSGDTIYLKVPIARSKTGRDYPIYLGLQLTPQQIEDNRRRSGR
jgi:hypothetical protein